MTNWETHRRRPPATSVDYDVTPPATPTGLAAGGSPTAVPSTLTWGAVVDSPAGPGPYSEWNAAAAQVMRIALQHGGIVGFQTAGNGIIDTAAKMQELIDDGISNYNMRFLETQPQAIDQFPGLLLTDPSSAQARLLARFVG